MNSLSPFIDTIRCHIALRVAEFGNTLSQLSAEIMDLDKDILDEVIGELEDIRLLLSKNIFQLDLYLSCSPGTKTPATLAALKNFKALKQTTEVLQLRGQSLLGRRVSSLSLRESRQSIQQSISTKRVTQLVFLFLPLSFSTSLFGMNVVELQDTRLRVVFATVIVTLSLSLLLWFATGWLSKLAVLLWTKIRSFWWVLGDYMKHFVVCFKFGLCAPSHRIILALFVTSHSNSTTKHVLHELGLHQTFWFGFYPVRAGLRLLPLTNPQTWWQRFWHKKLVATEAYLKTAPRPMKYFWGKKIGENSVLEP